MANIHLVITIFSLNLFSILSYVQSIYNPDGHEKMKLDHRNLDFQTGIAQLANNDLEWHAAEHTIKNKSTISSYFDNLVMAASVMIISSKIY